jgi:hypothetical protein
MTEREISQNLLMAYINIEAAKKSILVLWEFRDKIHNKDFIETIKQVKPKLNYFTKQIESTLLADPRFKTEHWEQIEEKCYECLEMVDEEIKKL